MWNDIVLGKNSYTRQYLEDKSTGDVPQNSHQDQTLSFGTTNSTLANEKESNDIKKQQLTLSEVKDELTQKNKKDKSQTNVLTLEDKAIEIPDKNESVKQPANDVYF